MGKLVVVTALLTVAVSTQARADERGWSWGGTPVANFDADAGFGFGGLGTVELRTPGADPYRASLALQIFVTSELVHAHEIRWDILQVGHPRLRLFGRAGYFSTVNRNYCGLGNAVTCDPAEAEGAAMDAGLSAGTDEWHDFVRRYYRRRFINPFAIAGARFGLDDRVSLFGLWRLSYYRAGTLTDRGPYPGSLYDRDFPAGEDGLASVPQVGIMYDTRDYEPSPSSGILLEASVHGAHRATGSSWGFAGLNATLRSFASLRPKLITATRFVADVATGDLPVEELMLVNASEHYPAFGGDAIGRGIRGSRYVGAVKLLLQQELRIRLPRRWVAVAFVDAGWIGLSPTEVGGDADRVLASGGAGLRWVRSASFILRADVGVSPHEDWAPQIYLNLGHVF